MKRLRWIVVSTACVLLACDGTDVEQTPT